MAARLQPPLKAARLPGDFGMMRFMGKTMAERTSMVYVIDDEPPVRRSLQLLLQSVGLPCATYDGARAFLDDLTLGDDISGCIVCDVRMPGMSGLELQNELNLRGVTLPLIFITGHGDVPMAVEAMQHGAFDFLQKPFRDQDLLDRVQKALDKDKRAREERATVAGIRARLASLTPREREVLQLMIQGKANKVMAADLNLSQRTVEIHRARVMDKMGARSLAELVRMAIDAGELRRTHTPQSTKQFS
ncbi:MAG: response regulator transcription factor [Steroidobacteraceae bacterium]|nr:response regulator transcription factor [Steroidobacteraceae bacterium]MDW8260358.1 response regulator transcription factor [Gammaproteobacteria bacterium]